MKKIFVAMLLLLCSAFLTVIQIKAADCCQTSECNNWSGGCPPSDNTCTDTCADVPANCGGGNPRVYGYCARTYTIPNATCNSGWPAWSSCSGGYETRTCANPPQLQIRACGSGGGGGNRQWSYGPNCGANEVRSSAVVGINRGGSCGHGINWQSGTLYSMGNAEVQGACCDMRTTEPRVCGDWYKCPTPSNPDKMCRDCTEEVIECVGWDVVEYQCVSTCDDTAPTNLACTTTSTTATITWTPGTGGSSQLIRVDEDLWEVENGCPTPGDCEAAATLTTLDTSEPVIGLLPNTTYHVRIVTYSDATCYAAAVTSFTTPNDQIFGIVYLDTANSCAVDTPMSGQSVTMDSSVAAVSGADGSYSFSANTASSHSLDIAIPTGYVCSTGATCANGCSKTGIISPSNNNYFYLTQNREAWWQGIGAGVYAGSTAGGDVIRSTIPSSVTALNRYLVIPGTAASAAVFFLFL